MEPLQKKMIGVGVVAVALTGVVIMMMFRGNDAARGPATTAVVQGGQTTGQDAAQTNHSPYYQKQLDAYNREQTELAERAGKTSVALLNPAEVQQSAPFQGAHGPQQSPQMQQPQQGAAFDPAVVQGKHDFFMRLMNDEKAGDMPVSRLVVQGAEQRSGAAVMAVGTGNGAVPAVAKAVLVPGGTTVSATLDASIDTDVPGDIFLTVRGGNLDGAQLYGAVKRVGDYASVKLTTMYWRDKTYAVNAVAMDPDTGRAVLSGEVDNKWMERFGWPFIVTAMTGAATIASQTPSTVVTSTAGATVANGEPQSKQIIGGALAAGTQSVAQAMAANGVVEKAVRRPADAVVVRFLTEVVQQSN